MIEISYIEEYNYAVDKGFNPLCDWRKFKMSISLRVEIQNQIFGKNVFGHGNILRANQKFYEYCWYNHWLLFGEPVHVCEECQKPLYNYAAVFISHIETKGAFAEMAHDPRNYNLLCYEHHQQWETGKRKAMKIYEANQIIIRILKRDYNEYRKSIKTN